MGYIKAPNTREAESERKLLRQFALENEVVFESLDDSTTILSKNGKSVHFNHKQGLYKNSDSSVRMKYSNPVMRAMLSLELYSWIYKK